MDRERKIVPTVTREDLRKANLKKEDATSGAQWKKRGGVKKMLPRNKSCHVMERTQLKMLDRNTLMES